jgi:hypothetical protein
VISIHTHICVYVYIYIEREFCYNAPTLIVIDLCSVATRLTLVAIGSRWAAIRWSSYNWFVPSCNGSDSLYLVPSSCN